MTSNRTGGITVTYRILQLIAIFFVSAAWAEGPYSILQGSTSENVTHFTVVAKADEELIFYARLDQIPTSYLPVQQKKFTFPGSEWAVHRIKVSGLNTQDAYVLDVMTSNHELMDRRHFRALDTTRAEARVAVGSCMARHMHNPYLWRNLSRPENRPDLLLLIGDTVYLDRPQIWPARPPETGLDVWTEFVNTRNTVELYFWSHLVPTISIWDDHDSGGDNSDMFTPILPTSREIFDVFFANEAIEGFLEHGPGLAKRFKVFGKNFIMLDGRSFRGGTPLNPLFGVEQNQFLLDSLQPGANFVISGSQFFGGPIQKDSLEANWPEFTLRWVEELRHAADDKNATLAFISGDVHFSEVQDLEPELFGYRTVEITSSNLHSFGFPGHYYLKPDNPRRRVVTGTHNVVLMEFDSYDFHFTVRSMGWRGNDLFHTVVSVERPEFKFSQGRCEDILKERVFEHL